VTTPEPKAASVRDSGPRKPGAKRDAPAPESGSKAPPPAEQKPVEPPIKVPDQVKELLDRLGKKLPDGVPLPLNGGPQGSNTDQLLDYLLSP
jgi:hypothetical protein